MKEIKAMLRGFFPNGFGQKSAEELQQYLRMENNRHFHLQLINELVTDFGTDAKVNFDQFCLIWHYLAQFRPEFEIYEPENGVITSQQFEDFLQNQVGCTIHKDTLETLVNFYSYLPFDACVHAQNKLRILSQTTDLSKSIISIETYQALCNGNTAPYNETRIDEPPSYEEATASPAYEQVSCKKITNFKSTLSLLKFKLLKRFRLL